MEPLFLSVPTLVHFDCEDLASCAGGKERCYCMRITISHVVSHELIQVTQQWLHRVLPERILVLHDILEKYCSDG